MPNRLKYQAALAAHHTASTVAHAGRCDLSGVDLYADGSNGVVCTIYDNSSAATNTTVLYKGALDATARSGGAQKPFPVVAQLGLYMVLSGTNGEATVNFIPE